MAKLTHKCLFLNYISSSVLLTLTTLLPYWNTVCVGHHNKGTGRLCSAIASSVLGEHTLMCSRMYLRMKSNKVSGYIGVKILSQTHTHIYAIKEEYMCLKVCIIFPPTKISVKDSNFSYKPCPVHIHYMVM